MNLGVGWGATSLRRFPPLQEVAFEARNPTTKNLGIVGLRYAGASQMFKFVVRASCREHPKCLNL